MRDCRSLKLPWGGQRPNRLAGCGSRCYLPGMVSVGSTRAVEAEQYPMTEKILRAFGPVEPKTLWTRWRRWWLKAL
jgi:hypothetical protein